MTTNMDTQWRAPTIGALFLAIFMPQLFYRIPYANAA